MRHHYTVKTYEEIREWARKFARDEAIHSLVIFGSAGLGKSETFIRALNDEYVITVKGRLSGFQLFNMLKRHKDALFLFDDTRRILRDPECVNLLMALGEHKMPKLVQWNTSTLPKKTNDDLDDADDANQILTRSRIILVINKVDEEDEDLEPIFSRSVLIRFAPSKEEVHHYVGRWFPTDNMRREIYDYVGSKLSIIPAADVRDYTKSAAIYDMNWKQQLNEAWTGNEYLTAAMRVLTETPDVSVAAQVQKFHDLCGGSRAQFFRLKKQLMPLRHEAAVSKSHPSASPRPTKGSGSVKRAAMT